MRESYNGWANYETWLTNLHMLDGMTPRDLGIRGQVTGEELREFVEESFEESVFKNPFVSDMVRTFLQEVDWDEIADHVNEDADIDTEEEE